MDNQIKVNTTNLDNLSSILGTHVVEEEDLLPQNVLWPLHMYHSMHVHSQITI